MVTAAAFMLGAARLDPDASASPAALPPLPRATALSWSPDGARIAFVSNRRLWTVDMPSGRTRRVATVVGLERPYLWQARHRIVYATPTSLRRFSLPSGRSTLLVRGDYRFDAGCFNCSTAARGVFDLSRNRRSLVARRLRPWSIETFTIGLATRRVRVVARDGTVERFPRGHPWQPLFGPGNVISRIAIAGGTLPPYVIAIHERRRRWRIVPPYNAVSGPAWMRADSRIRQKRAW